MGVVAARLFATVLLRGVSFGVVVVMSIGVVVVMGLLIVIANTFAIAEKLTAWRPVLLTFKSVLESG